MKLKKGSKAARDFMAKLRASRGKKKKVSGTKKPKLFKPTKLQTKKAVQRLVKESLKPKKVHTDVKSHNYRISISGAGDYAKFEISTIKALAKLLKKPLKTTQKAVYDNKNLLDLISFNFDQGTTPGRTAKILKDHLIPKKQIKPLDAFVNLLTKKGKGQSSTGSKANFPMKLPATVTIGALKNDTLQQIHILNNKINNCEALINHTQKMIFGKDAILKNPADRKIGKKTIATSRKYIALYKKQIRELKKHI